VGKTKTIFKMKKVFMFLLLMAVMSLSGFTQKSEKTIGVNLDYEIKDQSELFIDKYKTNMLAIENTEITKVFKCETHISKIYREEDLIYPTTPSEANFVAVGDGGYMAYSDNGINWTTSTVGDDAWEGVTYGGGKWVAVSYDGKIVYSTDGINWTTSTVTTNHWYGVTYGNGKFVAVSGGGDITYSTDGINWNTPINVGVNGWYGVTYGNEKFVAVSINSYITYSTDGINWNTPITVGSYYNSWYNVTYDDGKYVASGKDNNYNGNIAYSTDGINWTVITVGVDTREGVAYGGGKWVAVGMDSNAVYSTDCINWTVITIGGGIWYNVTYGFGKFVAVSYYGYIVYSTNGIDWSMPIKVADSHWRGVCAKPVGDYVLSDPLLSVPLFEASLGGLTDTVSGRVPNNSKDG
jgi:hypothetical protein